MKDEGTIEKRQDKKDSARNGNQNFNINKNFNEHRDEINTSGEIVNVPVLRTLHITPIQIGPVNFDEDQVKIVSRKKELIPDLKIQNIIDIKVKNYRFDDEILEHKYVRSLNIPFIDIMPLTGIVQREFTLNDTIVNFKNGIFELSIPNMSTINIKNISLREGFSFNLTVDIEIKRGMYKISNSISGNSSFNDELELPWRNKISPFGLPVNLSDRLFIIVVNTKYSEFVAINYRDFFRVKYGGTAEIERVENIEELEQRLEQTGEHKLIIVKNSKISSETKNHLDKLIDNASYQLNGCIILGVDDVETFMAYNQDINIIVDDLFEILKIYGEKLFNVISGFQTRTNSNKCVRLSDFQQNFKKSITDFDEKISECSSPDFLKENLPENLYNYVVLNRDLLVNTNAESEKNSTPIHSGMKAFIFLIKSKVNPDEIVLEDKNHKYCDVYVRSGEVEEYYEAETLFGRGDPIALLSSKIKNYEGLSGRLIFLLRNIDIIRYFYLLKELLGAIKVNQNFPEIEICGFNFNDNTLVSMKKISQYIMTEKSDL